MSETPESSNIKLLCAKRTLEFELESLTSERPFHFLQIPADDHLVLKLLWWKRLT